MYYCRDCGCRFLQPERYYETHGLGAPPYEKVYYCPNCKSTDFCEEEKHYCRACGARIKNGGEYCSSLCRRRGDEMRKRERLRRIADEKNPLLLIVRETEEYNKQHGTTLSYGEYTALVMPEMRRRKK